MFDIPSIAVDLWCDCAFTASLAFSGPGLKNTYQGIEGEMELVCYAGREGWLNSAFRVPRRCFRTYERAMDMDAQDGLQSAGLPRHGRLHCPKPSMGELLSSLGRYHPKS